MKKYIFVVLLIVGTIGITQAQTFYTLDHNGTPSLYQKLDSAIAYAVDGDAIYLPPGSHNIGNVTINKKLHIYGTGYHPDSTTATGLTYLSGNLYILDQADSSLLTGFELAGNITFGNITSNQKADYVSLIRLKFNKLKLGHSYSNVNLLVQNTYISECIFNQAQIVRAQDVLFELCIIGEYITEANNNVVFRNNIFTYNPTSSNQENKTPLGFNQQNSIHGVLFENNIFFDDDPINFTNYLGTVYAITNCTFNNNFFVNPYTFPIGSTIGTNNVTDSITTLFINPILPYGFQSNFHLKPSTVCENAGTDGTDMGIYGSLKPFKEGALPFNPHIRAKTITSQNNSIFIQINVSAEQR